MGDSLVWNDRFSIWTTVTVYAMAYSYCFGDGMNYIWTLLSVLLCVDLVLLITKYS